MFRTTTATLQIPAIKGLWKNQLVSTSYSSVVIESVAAARFVEDGGTRFLFIQ